MKRWTNLSDRSRLSNLRCKYGR